jgi:hypothetical protein
LYIVSPCIGRIPTVATVRKGQGEPRLKIASFGNLPGQTRGGSVSATIARLKTEFLAQLIGGKPP